MMVWEFSQFIRILGQNSAKSVGNFTLKYSKLGVIKNYIDFQNTALH